MIAPPVEAKTTVPTPAAAGARSTTRVPRTLTSKFGTEILDGLGDRAEGRKVDDGVHAPDGPDHGVLVPYVRLDDLDVEAVEVRGATAREIVESADFDAAGEQLWDEVRPDETACAGDEGSSRNLYGVSRSRRREAPCAGAACSRSLRQYERHGIFSGSHRCE